MTPPETRDGAFAPQAELYRDFDAGQIVREELRTLYSYWTEARQGHDLPARSDLIVERMKAGLGNIVLFELVPPDGRARYRLIGTRIVERDGFDHTGRFVDELPMPQYRALILDRIADILASRKPLLVRNKRMFDQRWYDYECLWLPLAADHRNIDMLLCCQIHFERLPVGRDR